MSTEDTSSSYISAVITTDMHAMSAMRCEIVCIGHHSDLLWTQLKYTNFRRNSLLQILTLTLDNYI